MKAVATLTATQCFLYCSRKKMSSCIMKGHDSDEEVDLEALRLAALKSRKPKYPRVNHNNLIPIIPVAVETPDFVNTKIKVERVSPTKETNVQDENKSSKENEDEKASNYSELTLENDQDILSMDDKEEEDSLERLMDQLEAEISGKAPIPTDRIVLSSKTLSGGKKEQKNTSKKKEKEGLDDEVELVQVKTGKEPNAIIDIRESASPELGQKDTSGRKSTSPKSLKRSRSRLSSRSRSPFAREKSYRRSRSPYWSRSPRRSRSPFRRSRSPYWSSRWTRSKSRSPFRRYRSPVRKRSPFSRFSRSRSISYGRRSPWSLSPRRRSKSPFYHDEFFSRHRNFNSPDRSRRSFSPRRRSRSPRRFLRNSPYHRSKSPFRRSRSPFRRTPRRSQSPFMNRSKSPLGKLNSPNRSPVTKRYSKSPSRRTPPKLSEKTSPKLRSKSPGRRYDTFRRSPGRPKDGRSLSISTSPMPCRNRSPLKVVEKNKLDGNEKSRERNRNERRHRSSSRENNRASDRRSYRSRYFRRFSPTRNGKGADRQSRKSRSPKPKDTSEKSKEESTNQNEKEPSPVSTAPLDPVLEARKRKFENLGEVDPTVDKKINLKAIKESTENPDDDEDALTINLESNLWEESEESEDECESRFKSEGAKKSRVGGNNRAVLSFRNLREGDAANKKINLNKPLIDDSRRDRFRRDRHDSWHQGRRGDRSDKKRRPHDGRSDEKDLSKNKSRGNDKNSLQSKPEKRSDRKPIVWSSKNDQKVGNSKDNEVSTTKTEVKENKSKFNEKGISEGRGKVGRDESKVNETDDFDKLISDFEKELESDMCLSTKELNSTGPGSQEDGKKAKLPLKKDILAPKVGPTVKKSTPRIVKISEASSNKADKSNEVKNANKVLDLGEKVEIDVSQEVCEGPEDYIEDDDFVLEVSAARKQKNKGEEEDSQSDLRGVLSRRRNLRLTKAVSLQVNMPTRLVQSAFEGLGNKKSKRQIREVQNAEEFPPLDKTTGAEGRRVLLLHREKNPIPSLKCTVPEVKPDTTIHQRFARSNPRRRRKLHKQLDSVEDVDQEEEEQEGFEVEEEKQFRRFRLKRNVTVSSQV